MLPNGPNAWCGGAVRKACHFIPPTTHESDMEGNKKAFIGSEQRRRDFYHGAGRQLSVSWKRGADRNGAVLIVLFSQFATF